MRRAALTGCSGHVGANLARQLVEQGCDVRALVREDVRAVEGLPLKRITGDLLDESALRSTFEGVDVVFHLAAVITLRPDRSGMVWKVNVEGTRNVVAACVASGVRRLVHFSSIHAFSAHPADQPVDETRAPAHEPDLPIYDRTKVAGEREAMKGVDLGLEVVIVNPTAVIGPYDYKPSAMGRVLLDLRNGRMPAVVKGGFNWVDSRDVAAGAIAASEKGRPSERYLLAGHHLSLAALARLASEVTGTPPPRFELPIWLAQAGLPFVALASALSGTEPRFTRASLRAVTQHQRISHAKASRELGYAPRPIRETIIDTYRWFEEVGYV